MAKKTQGTKLWTIDPDTETVLEVGCVTTIDGIDTTNEQIEITCLSDSARQYLAGLATPGQATFGINTDTADTSHVRLHQLKIRGDTLVWAIGWSDGTVAPTVDSGGTFDLGATRSWLRFNGFMTSYPFSFAQNSVVQSTVGIQISGEPQLIPKSS